MSCSAKYVTAEYVLKLLTVKLFASIWAKCVLKLLKLTQCVQGPKDLYLLSEITQAVPPAHFSFPLLGTVKAAHSVTLFHLT